MKQAPQFDLGYRKVDTGETNAPVLTRRLIVRDGASYETRYSNFDGYGNPGLVSETGPNGGTRATSLSYYVNPALWITGQVKDETYSGASIVRTFDAAGRLASITRDGVSTSYTYDSAGNTATANFPRGLIHSYSNYHRGVAQTEQQPEGVTITRVVDEAGNVTRETDGEGRVTTFRYDGLNRPIGVIYPQGNPVSIAYGPASKTATRGSLVETTTYDGYGRTLAVTLGGITRSFAYDALGRKVFASYPASSAGTRFDHDQLDRVVTIANPDSSASRIAYGPSRRSVSDERNKTSTYTYRSYGNPDEQFLMAIAAPEAAANVTITRNARDLVSSLTQAGLTRSYGYDARYYLTSVTHPETGTASYGRDAAGNLTTRTVGPSSTPQTSTYNYDNQNRLASATYPGNTPTVRHTYSRTHKIKTLTSTSGGQTVASRSYTYDANDNLVSETQTVDGLTLTAGYTYNANDQLTGLTYPRSSRSVTYTLDVLGRPSAIAGYVNGVSYWPSGQIRQITYANGTVTNYNQNTRLWPSSFTVAKGSGALLNASYTYDATGNLASISDSVDSGYNRSFDYDGINRLTTANGPWGSGAISYSGAGNITSQQFGSGYTLSYVYDTQNRLTRTGGSRSTSFSYDAYGDVTSAWGSNYSYDGVPNLRCANCGNPSDEVRYDYDGMNRRVAVTKAGVKTYEMYDSHGNLLVEYTPAQNKRLIEYIHLGGKRIAQRAADSLTSVALSVAPNPA